MTENERTSRLPDEEKAQRVRKPWRRRYPLVGQIARLSFIELERFFHATRIVDIAKVKVLMTCALRAHPVCGGLISE